jgi:hypothetical protein
MRYTFGVTESGGSVHLLAGDWRGPDFATRADKNTSLCGKLMLHRKLEVGSGHVCRECSTNARGAADPGVLDISAPAPAARPTPATLAARPPGALFVPPARVAAAEVAGARPDDPVGRWVDMTPEMAEKRLQNSAPNRPFRRGRASGYATDMKHGRWLQTGEPIKIDTNGDLIDGQHRLTAIIWAGVTVRMYIVEGVQPEVMGVIDTGIPRTFGDRLSMANMPHGKTLAAVTRRLFLWDQGIYLATSKTFRDESGTSRAPTHQEMDDYLTRHEQLHEVAERAEGWSIPQVAHSLSGICAALFFRLDRDAAISFMGSWDDGANLEPGNPIHTLRERIVRDGPLSESSLGRNYSSELKLAYACIAWNASREGRTLMKLQLPKGGLSNAHYPFPR